MPFEKETPDSLDYFFFDCPTKALKFKVRAPSDAHLAVSGQQMQTNPMFEVFVGGWKNSKVAFRKNREKPELCELELPGVLSADEYREFWLTYYHQTLAFGAGDNPTPMLVYTDPVLDTLPFVGIRTSWGASGSWHVDNNWPGWKVAESQPVGWVPPPADAPPATPGGVPVWKPCSGGTLFPDAVEGGFDNEKTYVGRALHNGATIPGKVLPSHGVCYVAWGGEEHGKTEYEVLTGCCPNWVPATGDQIPMNALQGGVSETGEPLFVGRAQHLDTLTVGKVQPSHKVCYISYGGEEIAKDTFEVLVL
ncbi:uncharacterized protein LOC106670473 [Cimex lectularius]|uniref:Farnesoic acid O-methyl transferase domain-containing protein n=1 Tax=Cimex lectularius TaxID=79782 RepID=A0A8I6S3U4_CIMLE|nr:uncharacterized protein LOC106670473 [Cimex lectularius]